MDDKQMREFVVKELSKFNFTRYTKGFKYLVDTIVICIKDTNAMDNLWKNVYPFLVEKYHEKSILNLKGCIEQAVITMYEQTDEELISDYFGLEKRIKPTLKLIVYTIVCKYQWKYTML